MVRRSGYITVPALLAASIVLAPAGLWSQIIVGPEQYPGQYPGGPGQYPGGPGQYPGQYPGGVGGGPVGRRQSRTETTKEEQARTATIAGMLRRISKSELVVQAEDKRIVTVALPSSTKYLKASGATAKTTDFSPGDHISIDATQDDNGYYHAKNVTLIKQGNAEDQVAAAEPVDESPLADGVKNNSSGPGDDGPPKLRRNDSKSSSSSSSNSDDGPPRIRRADSAESSASASTAQPEAPRSVARNSEPDTPVPPDPNEAGPPKLRRGRPAQTGRASSDAPVEVAKNEPPAPRPSLHADEVNGVTKAPAAPVIDNSPRSQAQVGAQSSGDPVIDKARDAAFSFAETLPNYVVKQFTTRYQTDAAHGNATSWNVVDTVTADVVSEGGKDTYKNVLINGKPPKEAIEKTGSWSTGEFSSVLLDVLSPSTDADFHNRRSTTIVNRQAFRYDFSVDQQNSHWHVYSAADSYQPAYTGAVWVDKETSRLLRIEMSAQSMPRAFPLDTVESAVDYDFVQIGDAKFLLPVHSETLSCERGTRICSRNVIDFRNYKKFGADTSITFDAAGK